MTALYRWQTQIIYNDTPPMHLNLALGTEPDHKSDSRQTYARYFTFARYYQHFSACVAMQ